METLNNKVPYAVSYKVYGTDYGELNCSFEDYSNGKPIQRTNYYHIPLVEKTAIDADFISESNSIELRMNNNVIPESDKILVSQSAGVMVGASANNSNMGSVYGAGEYVKGDTVVLRAIPNKGYAFAGWLNGSTIMSLKENFEFTAIEETNLTAMFYENIMPDSNYSIELCGGYNGLYEALLESRDNEFILSFKSTAGDEAYRNFTACIVDYNLNGQMVSYMELDKTRDDNTIVFTGHEIPFEGKLIVFDENYIPVIESFILD